jgi:hypothetical protein
MIALRERQKMADKLNFQPEEAQASPTSTNLNESQLPSHTSELTSGDAKQCSSQESAKEERIEQSSIHQSTGPRTAQGKGRSKLNALKHGLLSKVTLLKGESPTEYNSLLNGLLDDWLPQGKSETLDVEDLAAVWWNKRRLFQAKNAVIAEKIEFIERDFEAKRREEASEGSRTAIATSGLLRYMTNPYLIREAKELLTELRRNIVAGNNVEGLSGMLMQLYGKEQVGVIPQLLLPHSGTSVDQSNIVASMIDDEVKRLTKLEKDLVADDSLRIQFKKSAAVIPSQGVSDRLMRYETHLDRKIDQISKRLEASQRRRKGQPPPPQLNVNIL